MTQWLGMGGDGGTTDTDVKEREEEGENAEYFTSTMTGWLGFGGEKETANSAEKEEEEEEERKEDEEQEPAETFRSRRMSLDLEGSQLHEEEEKETGTMDWLGSGLSNTLGFGWTNQESERTESQVQETTKEEEQPASGSWYDLGIGDILGYNKDKTDESTGSGFQEPEDDETLDQQTGSERVDTSQLQPTLTEEVRTETIHESKMVKMTEDQNAQSETAPGTTEPITADSDNNSTGASDSKSRSSDLPGSAAAEAVGGKSSTPDSFSQIASKEDDKEEAVIDYKTENTVLVGERSAEIESKDHQTSKAIKHEGDDNDSHTREEKIKTVSETDQDLLTQSHIDVLSNLSSMDSTGRPESGFEEDKTENQVGESDKIQSHIDESADLLVNISARKDEHEEGVNNEEADGLHRDITETEGSAEHIHIGSVAGESMVENHNQIFNKHETLERIGSVADQGSVSPDKQLNANRGEEDAQEQRDTVTDTEIDNLQSVTTITTGIEKYALNESGPTSFKDSDTETEIEEEGELNGEREQMGTEELKKEQKQMELKEEEEIRAQEEQQEEDEEKQDKVKESKEEEKQQEVKEISEKGKPGQLEEEKEERTQEAGKESKEDKNQGKEVVKQDEIDELKEEEKKQEVKEISDEGKLLESEELMEEKTQLDIKEIKEVGIQEEFGESKERQEEEAMQDEMEELKEEEKQQEVKEISKNENPVGLEELKEEVEEIKDEGSQEEFGESKEKEIQEEEKVTQDETEELKVEERQEEEKVTQDETEELKVEERQEEEMVTQDETEELKEEERQEEEKVTQDETEELKVEERQEEEKVTQDETEELKEEERQEEEKVTQDETEELKVEERQEEEMVTQDETEELKVEERQEEEKVTQDETEELKEEERQEEEKVTQDETEELKVEERQEEEKVTQDETEELKVEEKRGKVEDEQHPIEEIEEELQRVVEESKEREQTEEFKLLFQGSEKEKKDCEEEQVKLSHFEQEIENMNRPDSESKEKETQDEESVETSSQTDERQTENPQVEEAEKEEENKQKESLHEVQDAKENVEGERRKKEEDGSEEQFVRARDGKDSTNKFSKEEGDVVAGNLNPESNMTLKGTERDDDRQQEGGVKEDKRHDDAEADLNALGLNQSENMENTNNDLIHSVEGKEVSSSQTTEVKEKIPELTGDKVLYQEDKTNVEETGSKELSHEDKIEMKNGDYNKEERELNDDEKLSDYADVKVTNQNMVGTELMTDGKIPPGEVFEAQAVISEETAPQRSTGSPLQSHSLDDSEAESGGAFGLFQNAFSYFRQTPTAETKESTDTAQSLDSYTLETSTALTPEEEADTATESSQVYVQDLLTDTSDSLSHKQPSLLQTPYSHPSSIPLNAETPSQTKTLSRFYKNLLAFMSADDVDILMDLFGRHKLQFLDDVLGSSETMTGDPDTTDSIVLDVERLLHHHMEMLVAPSKRLQDAPQEDKEKTKTLLALQKLEMLLAKVRETFSTGKPDTSNTSHQADGSCVGESCSTPSKDKEMYDELQKVGDSSVGLDTNTPKDEWMGRDKQSDKKIGGGTEEERVTKKEERDIEPGPPKKQEGLIQQTLDFVHKIAEDSSTHVHAARELLVWLTVQVVSALPDDIRPGPDLYGLPWEPVIVSSLVGLVTMLLFTCRCYSSVKSRFYRSKERWMAEQVAQLLDEKCKVLETLSKCQQEYDDLEGSLRDSGVLAQTKKTEELEVKARQMGHDKKELERDLKQLKDQLDQQKEHRKEQERRIAVLEESMETSEEETKDLHSQEEQAQTTLKVYNMNSERLQRNMETAGEENKLLQESNAQLRQQVEGWAERVSELEEEISRCEVSHSGMLQDVTNKDERIWSLTDRLLRMKAWDPDMEEEGGQEEGEQETSNGTARRREENGRGDKTDTQGHLQKVQKLIYAAKLNADLKSVDEDKDRAFAKLNDEIKAKEDLEVSIKELENEKLSLQSDSEHYSDQVQRLQQKLNIMTEMYQEKELKLHRLLTVEEKERMQKEERLNKADKNIALAMEELNNYRQRAEEMEEELEKSKQSYQTQISAHEKKAHNNWLAARAAERELADIRRENALFRQKLTDTQFKLDALDKDPYALDSLARPLPFRERSPYAPSPLGRPASETRAFLSPPTLMDGPPARLSPRVPRGPMDPPGGPGDMERSGGPHSDSGSISPTWERDRRGPPPGPPGPLGHPGYMFSDPGGPMYRRAPPPPGAMGPFPTPGPFPPGPLPPRGLPPGPFHPADMTDGSFRENSFGPGEMEHRESGPGDRRTPPEAESRTGGPLLPGHPMGPMDGPFPRRPPYGPPPPDFYPPRIPGGPPMRPMWALPPPGMMFPPRFPPGGPLPPHPQQAPMMRPPLPDGLPPPSMGPLPPRHALPSPPHSQSPEQHTPSPEDAI
ncbi:cTAGE family member 5 isoform X2 [Labrus bergylta]|uniref:cTAGE family member 5 isoform X2 n=1 Tax=Labrus bergylta TaxID=56723 RepID=UPI0033133212